MRVWRKKPLVCIMLTVGLGKMPIVLEGLNVVNVRHSVGEERSESRLESQKRPKVLFLCTGNSCRSQMAEGWARHFFGERMDVYSAGVVARGLNANAVAVMAEEGVDIGNHESTTVEELGETEFDVVITVCDNVKESCPIFHGDAVVVHRSFDDPPSLEAAGGSESERLAPYRRVRDEIREYIRTLPAIMGI